MLSGGWVPIVYFATALLTAISDLVRGASRSEIQFTENETTISFERHAGRVPVTSTINGAWAECDLNELRKASVDFVRRLFDEIILKQPWLLAMTVVRDRLRLVAAVAGYE